MFYGYVWYNGWRLNGIGESMILNLDDLQRFSMVGKERFISEALLEYARVDLKNLETRWAIRELTTALESRGLEDICEKDFVISEHWMPELQELRLYYAWWPQSKMVHIPGSRTERAAVRYVDPNLQRFGQVPRDVGAKVVGYDTKYQLWVAE